MRFPVVLVKVNVKAQQEFKLFYYDVTVQHVSNYTPQESPNIYW